MSKRSSRTVEEKLTAVLSYLEGVKSVSRLAQEYKVSQTTLKAWVRHYQVEGLEGLKERHTWKVYKQELKLQAVLDYLEGHRSQKSIIETYDISDRSVLKRWIKQYTSGKELKATCKGLSRMKQGRKTTFEERIEIVNFIIAHEKNYQAAIEKYGVSYQQVYSWVRKFEKNGSDGLLDRRGKGLESKPNLTPEEELQLKIKQLEERNRYLEMEVGLLKKLEEIRRNKLR